MKLKFPKLNKSFGPKACPPACLTLLPAVYSAYISLSRYVPCLPYHERDTPLSSKFMYPHACFRVMILIGTVTMETYL